MSRLFLAGGELTTPVKAATLACPIQGENMDLTEAEAMEKWCPFAMVKDAAGSYNRSTNGHASFSACCIGSRCMAWRFTGYKPVAGGTNDEAHGRCGMVTTIQEAS